MAEIATQIPELNDDFFSESAEDASAYPPSTLELLTEAFPFPEIRAVQTNVLEVVARSFDTGKQFTIAEVPTGGGKSPVGIAAARFAQTVEDAEPGAHLLTSQNNLLTQMMNDFGDLGLVELRGKANYWCEPHRTDCASGSSCNPGNKTCEDCPYKAAKDRFMAAPMGVTNYTYYLTEARYVRRIEPRSFLILDEVHNLEEEILSTVEVKITDSRVQELGIFLPDFGEDQRKVREWLAETFLPQANAYGNDLKAKINATERALAATTTADPSSTKSLQTLSKKLASIASLIGNAEAYLADDGSRWLAWTEKKGALTIRPLSAADYAQGYLLGRSPNVLMMSATLLDPKTFMRSLGIQASDANYFAAPSDFPKEHRRIVYWPTGSMGFKDIEATLPRIAQRTEKLLDKYAEQKGIIHSHSYRINDYLQQYFLKTKHRHRIITHSSAVGEREKAIETHYRSEDSTILLSPSMTEGLDLKDDLSRFQVITKVPYPYLDPYTRARMERDDKWYQLKTALTLVQATGRSVRSREDWAVTVILDSAFERFLIQNQDILPDWWKAAIEFK
jgi:Rad3-related DNA helicase